MELWISYQYFCLFSVVTACLVHQKIINSQSYTNLPKIDTFHYTIWKKSHLLISSLISIDKFLNIWYLQWQIPVTQNYVSYESLNSLLLVTVSIVFLEVTSSLHLFLTKCLHKSDQPFLVYQSLFQIKTIPWKMWLGHLTIQTIT